MNVLLEYIEQVVTELKRDHRFIKTLKAVRVRREFSATSVERLVDEWVGLHSNLRLKPIEIRLARRVAQEKFPELYEKYRGDVNSAKKSLFITLSALLKRDIK